MQITIVIPTYNRCDDLIACLESLEKVSPQGFRIIVVDNASTDGTNEQLLKRFPHVETIILKENLGATGASNIGFCKGLEGDADYILRLDSDTIVKADFLEQLLNAARQHPEYGVFSPKIYYYDQPDVIWYAGAEERSWDLGVKNDHRLERDSPSTSQLRRTDFAWAAAMLTRRDILEKTRGFDEKFFIYYEEMDFCRRVRELGHSICFVPASIVWHKVGTLKENAWRAYHWNRSKIIYYRKHASNPLHRLFLVFYALPYLIFRAVFHKIGAGNRGPFGDALKGFWDGLSITLD